MERSAGNEIELYRELEKARGDWQLALQQFEYAVESAAIDAAAYKILAAERKYMYLLKKVGEEQSSELSRAYAEE